MPEFLQRHEDREHDDAEPANPRERRRALHRTGRRHDQAASEAAKHDTHDHDHDRRHQAREVPNEFREDAGQRLEAERRRRDHDDREHHDPEQRLADDLRGIEVRAAALHGLHDATALQRLVQPDAMQQSLGALLDQLRQQVAGEKDDERAEHRRNHFGQLRECFPQALEEGQGLVVGELNHDSNLGDARSEVRAQSSEEQAWLSEL